MFCHCPPCVERAISTASIRMMAMVMVMVLVAVMDVMMIVAAVLVFDRDVYVCD